MENEEDSKPILFGNCFPKQKNYRTTKYPKNTKPEHPFPVSFGSLS